MFVKAVDTRQLVLEMAASQVPMASDVDLSPESSAGLIFALGLSSIYFSNI